MRNTWTPYNPVAPKQHYLPTPLKHEGRSAHPSTVSVGGIMGMDPEARRSLIDLLHLGALIVVLLERWQLLDVIGLVVVLNGETELDHAVDAAGEGGGLVEREARGEERGLEKQVDQVLDGLVALVGGGLLGLQLGLGLG